MIQYVKLGKVAKILYPVTVEPVQLLFHVIPNSASLLMGLVASYWFAPSLAIYLLFILMFVDYVTGICAAIIKESFSSVRAWQGAVRKFMMLLIISGTHAVYLFLRGEFGFDFDITRWMSLSLCVMECSSIMENCVRAGIWIPPFLIKYLAKAKSELNQYAGPEQREFQRVFKGPEKRGAKRPGQ